LKAEFLNDGVSTPSPANWHAIGQPGEGRMAKGWESQMPSQPAVLATMFVKQAKLIPRSKRLWKVELAAVAIVVVVACWIANSDRYPASFLGSSGLQRSTAIEEQLLLPSHKVMPKGRFMFQAVPGSFEEARTGSRFQGLGVGENEVVQIGDDVTVRYFTPNPAPPGVRVRRYQIVHIGEDVTVRYFTPMSPRARN
jgi:hypothetical protein